MDCPNCGNYMEFCDLPEHHIKPDFYCPKCHTILDLKLTQKRDKDQTEYYK